MLQSLALAVLLPALAVLSQSFENSAIVRTVELGGSLVHVTTTYAVKALSSNPKSYTIALSKNEVEKTSWLEVKVKGKQDMLVVTNNGLNDQGIYLLDVALPEPLALNSTVNLVLETVQTHATWPWPESAAQGEDQALKYETDLLVLSPYRTKVQRTKLKSPSSVIRSYTTPIEKVSAFSMESQVTKSGATVTYGPYNGVPVSTLKEFISESQQPIQIHYNYEYPVTEIMKLKRSAEISHWGANLNIQNEIHLRNAGPALKGHFSRLQHQTQTYYKQAATHVLLGLTLHLPAGIRNTYYYDTIGNVSTSRLRSPPAGSLRNSYSIFEMKPRFPLMGGWNYTFTLGWDAPLEDSVRWDKGSGKYIAQIPVLTEFPTAVVDDAELAIVLPEGATEVEYTAPFPAISSELVTHTTYLDTTGRPALIFHYKNLTDRHVKSIFVSYKVPFSAHFKKPRAVATVFFGLFAFAIVARRVDLSIQKKKKV
ncbi:Ribophorin I [Mycena floridula]|nr:Ribophorin I [Mycena floridula]